jgi:D-glycero-D-manno-heptose 1,7-bisphosphate phosphatase
MARWNIKKSESLLIGDQGTDIEAADAAGLAGHKFAGGNLNEFLCRLGLI